MAFTRKKLAVTFKLGTGNYGESGYNTVKFTDLRASAFITSTGGPSFSRLELEASGIDLSTMNQLSTLGQIITVVRRNTIIVEAGDDASGLSVVYQGQIIEAWVDASSMPNIVFRVKGGAGSFEAVKPVPPTTYNGLASVATIMSSLATQADLIFTNDGVQANLIDPYFPGTTFDQIRRCAEAANINWIIDKGTLAIWPKGGSRGGAVPVVSPDTGMIGYPTFTSNGIQVTTLYNPSINYGQKIEVRSSLTPACGVWTIVALYHHLEAETPGGQWSSTMTAVPPGLAAIGGIITR